MRCRLIAILLILVIAAPCVAIEQDKVGHFAVGSALGFVGTTAENGFWLSVSVSALKELADSCGMGTPEWEDFGAGSVRCVADLPAQDMDRREAYSGY